MDHARNLIKLIMKPNLSQFRCFVDQLINCSQMGLALSDRYMLNNLGENLQSSVS